MKDSVLALAAVTLQKFVQAYITAHNLKRFKVTKVRSC